MLLCEEHRTFLLSYDAPQDSMLPPVLLHVFFTCATNVSLDMAGRAARIISCLQVKLPLSYSPVPPGNAVWRRPVSLTWL